MFDHIDWWQVAKTIFESSPLLWGVVIVVVVAAVFVAVFLPENKKPGFLYRKKIYVMTQSEMLCFKALQAAVGDKFYIFPQIHLDALLDHKVFGQNWVGAFRRMNQKSVDFILCDKEQLTTVLAIELDDRSHERLDRQERDGEVERALADAGLPLLRLKPDFAKENLVSMIGVAINIPVR